MIAPENMKKVCAVERTRWNEMLTQASDGIIER